MRRALDCVEMMTYERYVSALRPYMNSTRTHMADQASDAEAESAVSDYCKRVGSPQR
jgi:hypothetical protein